VNPNVLFSYWYYSTPSINWYLAMLFGPDRQTWPSVILDSGAVSASNLGAHIDMPGYARWVKDAGEAIEWAANLDVIGNSRLSQRNYDVLRALGIQPVPVVHGGAAISLVADMCQKHDVVAVGGMVRKGQPIVAARKWLVMVHRVAQEYGTKLHGFGMTRYEIITEFPWASVDSSSWGMGHRVGHVHLWTGSRIKQIDLTEVWQYEALVRDNGGDPAKLTGEAYHYRWVAEVNAISWLRLERALQRSRLDFKLHLADSNDRALMWGIRAWKNWLAAEALV
jgi:hypothetical protein